jgi:hypothetical protein
MSDKKGNTGVIIAVVSVVVVSGVALYLLSRKTKKIDEQLVGYTGAGGPVVASTDPAIVGSTSTPPYIDNGAGPNKVDWSGILNGIFGIGNGTKTVADNSDEHAPDNTLPDRVHENFCNWVKG